VHVERIESPYGACVICTFEPDEQPGPVAGEIVRNREFARGRAALRVALGFDGAIGATDRGAPAVPAGWSGSLSHKGELAAAIAAPADAGWVGIDLELAVASRQPIERRILTPREARASGRDVTRVFAIKEAIYKAIDPIVRRYVAFTEVELEIGSAGACTVRIVDPSHLPVEIEAWWAEHAGHWLATARARAR
jgi:4'-phosphopantetheinyl transferase EntD